ncbi:hypothetical protein E4U42_002280 [Claviceps africana]|uniref:HhH-GPD domain-containing protein n=1 Tax=Claviceps africana TaxID=83212 RepID=A0A8K0J8J7_9HYPO|nr:hypothetical protein E4U42_002280 [Claviceps africana]
MAMAATRRSSRLSAQAKFHSSNIARVPASASIQNDGKRKASTSRASSPSRDTTEQQQQQQQQPMTPTKRRTQHTTPVAPSLSTTAAPEKAENSTSPSAGETKPRNAKVARLADPMATNAALLAPETSRVVASERVEPASSCHTPTAMGRQLTTENLLDTACAHLISIDARVRPLVEKNKNHCKMFSPEGLAEKIDPFESLASGIISQQVSGAAAKSIKAKFVALFDDDGAVDGQRFPHPSQVVACSLEKLRTAGLSQRKAEYIKGLADKFDSGELSAQMLHEAPYEELVEKLIAVRGLGKWSVEMFACFGLKRMDVFSVGDLGVQRGMAAFVGRDVAKLKSKGGKWKYMSEQEMLEISGRFAPYRSLFMWLMWRVEDSFTDVSTLE